MSLLILFDSSGGGPPTAQINVEDINICSKRLVRILFDDEVIVNDNYNDPTNYTINVVEGTGPVEVVGVLPVNTSTSLDIILITQPMTAGTEYQIVTGDLQTRSNLDFQVQGNYIARVTKTDSLLRSIPQHYDKRVTSNLHAFLMAFGKSDDIIGGSRDDDFGIG